MSKNRNYRKMYTAPESEIEEQQVPAAEVESEEQAETIVCPEQCEYVNAVVSGCSRLNVREHPNATAPVKSVLIGGSEVEVCTAHNYEDWYEVCTASGVEGYCMKQYITVI